MGRVKKTVVQNSKKVTGSSRVSKGRSAGVGGRYGSELTGRVQSLTNKRDTVLYVWVEPENKEWLESMTTAAGVSMSAYVNELLTELRQHAGNGAKSNGRAR